MQAVVLSGGVGSRLWPISSKIRPKPFLVLEDGQSLLQKAFIRAANIDLVTDIITVTNHDFFSQVRDEYSRVSSLVKKPIISQFILEPFGKNTAAAIAAAALQIDEYYGPDEVMLVLPADHLILDKERFEDAVRKAQKLALDGELVTFGIKPDSPETGYGYIEHHGNKVERFVEKPSLELAQEYLQNGKYLWNSGIFCFTVGSILREMALYCPLILDNVGCSMHLSNRTDNRKVELNSLAFSLVPEESIDYAVMEKSARIAVIPCDIGWKDIGTWDSFSKLAPEDSDGNRIKGNATLHDVSNCYIENNGQLVGVVGVKNLAIISTKNGLLVTNKQNSEAVRNIYSQLYDHVNNDQNFPWGKVLILQKDQLIKLNQVEINPGATVEIAKHFQYAANWMVTRGIAKFLVNNQQIILSKNESKYIPQGDVESIINIGNEPLVIITVQLDDYLAKNDIVTSIEIDKASNG